MFTAVERQGQIGGSEVAAAVGLNKYHSRYRLWQEKLGLAPAFSGNNATAWGVALEPFLRQQACKHFQKKWRQSHRTFVDKEHSFLVSHVDGLEKHSLLECKKTSFRNKKQFAETGAVITEPYDGLPIHYYCQTQHYMHMVGKEWCAMSVGIAGEDDIRFFWVAYNALFAEDMRQKCIAFWRDHVLAKVAPDIDLVTDINQAYPKSHDAKTIQANAELLALCALYRAEKQNSTALAERLQSLEVEIKKCMCNAEAVLGENEETLCTWKNVTRKSLDTKKLRSEQGDLIKSYERETSTRAFKFFSDG